MINLRNISKIGFLLLFFLFLITPVKAQLYKYQAAFIYNFTKYIEWPSDNRKGDFIIGILGEDAEIISSLERMALNKKVGSQSIEITIFKNKDAIKKCHILFIPKNKSEYLSIISKKTLIHNTLIITSKEGLAKKGSAINFVVRNNKQKFELNKKNAERYNLKVSKLLERLAIIIN